MGDEDDWDDNDDDDDDDEDDDDDDDAASCTMVQISLILRYQNSHFPTSLGVSEVSERANK